MSQQNARQTKLNIKVPNNGLVRRYTSIITTRRKRLRNRTSTTFTENTSCQTPNKRGIRILFEKYTITGTRNGREGTKLSREKNKTDFRNSVTDHSTKNHLVLQKSNKAKHLSKQWCKMVRWRQPMKNQEQMNLGRKKWMLFPRSRNIGPKKSLSSTLC